MRTRRLEYLRPEEIAAAVCERSVAYLPIGPLEWHGPHLPYGTDPLIAWEVALGLAERLGGIVHPCLFLGTERERDAATLKKLGFDGSEWVVGMDFPGNRLPSLYIPEEVVAIVIRHQVAALQRMGFGTVVLVNGHGGRNHVAALGRVAAELSATGPGRVRYVFAWPEGAGSWSRRAHASTDETAVMRALLPEAVETGTLPPAGSPIRARETGIADEDAFEGRNPDGAISEDPRTAGAELGRRHLADMLDGLVRLLEPELKASEAQIGAEKPPRRFRPV